MPHHRFARLIIDLHYAVLTATEDMGWRRPFWIIGWWISFIPKLPFMIGYAFDYDDEDDQHYPGR